jgi:hypothetical protein
MPRHSSAKSCFPKTCNETSVLCHEVKEQLIYSRVVDVVIPVEKWSSGVYLNPLEQTGKSFKGIS